MLNEVKPITAIIISSVVAFLIAHGYVETGNQVATVTSLNDLVGGLIAIAAAVAALHRYVILHPVKTAQPVQNTDTTATQDTTTVTPDQSSGAVG